MSRKHDLTATIFDRRGRILSIARNSYIKTHPFQARCAKEVGEPTKIFLHAEIAALVKLPDWTKAHKIVVMRFNKQGLPVSAAPCKCCLRALSFTNIVKIEHT